MNPISVQTTVNAPIEKVWEFWNGVEHFAGWAFASDDWAAEGVENNVTVGGQLKVHNFAKDQSMSFYFQGTYTVVEPQKLLEFDLSDTRHVRVEFVPIEGGVQVVETFDPENENSIDMQRAGWQAYLDNFKKYVESH